MGNLDCHDSYRNHCNKNDGANADDNSRQNYISIIISAAIIMRCYCSNGEDTTS